MSVASGGRDPAPYTRVGVFALRLGVFALLMAGVTGCAGQPSAGTPASHAHAVAQAGKRAPARARHRQGRMSGGHQHAIRLVFSRASNRVVQAQPAPGSCHTRGQGQYSRPDLHCTPGALNPAVRQANIHHTICVTGWTATVRPPESVTEAEKRASLEAYGDTGPLHGYEYDHLVPLELGGAANDPRNLWPEPGPVPNPKDAVELDLRDRVCSGEMTLNQAQREIAGDWVKLALGGGGRSAGSAGSVGSAGSAGPAGSAGSAGPAAHCRAHAVYDPSYGDFDVYVDSNQPDRAVTVRGAGHVRTWHTDGRGSADVYFPAGSGSRGRHVIVTVGSARCATTL